MRAMNSPKPIQTSDATEQFQANATSDHPTDYTNNSDLPDTKLSAANQPTTAEGLAASQRGMGVSNQMVF